MTTERTDLYAVLGVAPHATQAEISHAYRALLRQHHPDTRAPGDESQHALSDAALQEVLAAYTMLGDPARRADYDKETQPHPYPTTQPPQRTLHNHGALSRSPIVAGPVHWHRAPDPSRVRS